MINRLAGVTLFQLKHAAMMQLIESTLTRILSKSPLSSFQWLQHTFHHIHLCVSAHFTEQHTPHQRGQWCEPHPHIPLIDELAQSAQYHTYCLP